MNEQEICSFPRSFRKRTVFHYNLYVVSAYRSFLFRRRGTYVFTPSLCPFLFVYRQSYWRNSYLVFFIVQAIVIGFWVYMFGPMFFWLSAYSSNMISLLSGRKRLVAVAVYILVGMAYGALGLQ